MSIPQLASIFLNLNPSQLLSLNIIPLSNNINKIINNNNISNIDFSGYNSNELLFLTETQVQNLSIHQLKTILLINPKLSGLMVVISKLSLDQIKLLLNTDDYVFPLNRLSISQLESLPKSYFSNMPKTLQPSILTLSEEKYNIISKHFSSSQLDTYNKFYEKMINSIINIIKIDINKVNIIYDDNPTNATNATNTNNTNNTTNPTTNATNPTNAPNATNGTNAPNAPNATNGTNVNSILIYIFIIFSSPIIGSKLLKQNIDVVGFLKKLPIKIIDKLIIKASVENLAFLDPYTLNLYNDADFISSV
jgi:hypothetical protein